jgi:hypothetical protein
MDFISLLHDDSDDTHASADDLTDNPVLSQVFALYDRNLELTQCVENVSSLLDNAIRYSHIMRRTQAELTHGVEALLEHQRLLQVMFDDQGNLDPDQAHYLPPFISPF